jgi:hypothetical protein
MQEIYECVALYFLRNSFITKHLAYRMFPIRNCRCIRPGSNARYHFNFIELWPFIHLECEARNRAIRRVSSPLRWRGRSQLYGLYALGYRGRPADDYVSSSRPRLYVLSGLRSRV